MEFKNYMEELAGEVLRGILEGESSMCRCDRCRTDVVAYALNRLPSKYAVTDDFPKIKGNRTRIERLFTNLISNAVKFNDRSNPVVEVGICHPREGGDPVDALDKQYAIRTTNISFL